MRREEGGNMNDFSPVWFTTEDFITLTPNDVFHKECEQKEIFSKIKNYHCLARADYLLSDEKAVLCITADDYYKLYINGRFICQGPAPSYTDSYYYNEIDITPFLNKGKNVIAVHLYYQGLVNRVWQSGDNRFGLGAVINGRNLIWKYKISNAFSGIINGYDTDFTESFDGRLWENDWNKPDFDDGEWKPMLCANTNYIFVKQPAKMLSVYTLKPKIYDRKKDRYFVDTGQEIAGGLRLKCQGHSGDEVLIRYGEDLGDDGSVRYKLRANCIYEEKWILKDGENEFESYFYKGFRYVEIITENELTQLDVVVRHYPFDDSFCNPLFKDERLSKIFTLCKNTVKYATQECFIDCPTREKGQYLGDTFITAHSHMLLTGDTSLTEKAIDEFAKSSKICKGLMAVAPCSLMQEIADYSLLFGELLLLCYSFNKDKSFLKKYYSVAKNIIIHFKKYERPDGLLNQVSDKWNMVDWGENMRDNYDFPLTRPVVSKGAHTVINAYYIGAVSTLNQIERIIDMNISFDLEALKKAYIKAFMRDNLFADSEMSNHCSLHSNALSLYFDLCPDSAREEVADYIIKKGFSCGVFMSYFVMKALAKVGRKKELFELLTNDSGHGWLNMIKEGATTCLEAWGKNQKWNTSLCHPWASAPISIILEELNDYVIPDND